jgi:leucyl-tRNA synthetase
LQRVWTLVMEFTEIEKKDEGHNSELDVMVTRAVHKAIKKVSEDINDFSFNTALASLMECVNELYKLKSPDNFDIAYGAWLESLENLVQLSAPFSPHIAEELWQALGHEESVHISRWPQWDEKLVADDTFRMAVQVNGKLRGEVEVPVGASQQAAEKLARADDKIADQLTGHRTKKVIYVPDRLINFVI